MDSVLKIICALTISASISVQGMQDSANTWETRVQATLTLLQTRPCWGLSRDSECHPSISSNLNSRKVRLYTAEGQKKLRVVLPVRKRRRLTIHSHRNNSYDAVFVLDPFPDASFGHLVFIFLVNYDVNETFCNKTMNGFHLFTDRNECIRRAEKRHCKNRHHSHVRCEINFIPLVHKEDDNSDKAKTQLLECRKTLNSLTFANCGEQEDFSVRRCENSASCLDSNRPTEPQLLCMYKQCDHAVLVSGGWNSYTSRPHDRKNLLNVWKLLHSTMGYEKEKIVTFFAQGRKEELAVHQRANSYAVRHRATRVKEHIKLLCRSLFCVDTLTLYLTGPSNSDGALMFRDSGDGLTEGSDLYTPKQILEDIKNCSAKRIFLVADYSYSGAMINRLRNRIKRHPDQFRNIVAISSTGWGEYTRRSDFTNAFVKHNKRGNATNCVSDVFEGIKQELRTKGTSSTPQIIGVDSSAAGTTLSGDPCNEPWSGVKARDGCQFLEREDVLPELLKLGLAPIKRSSLR